MTGQLPTNPGSDVVAAAREAADRAYDAIPPQNATAPTEELMNQPLAGSQPTVEQHLAAVAPTTNEQFQQARQEYGQAAAAPVPGQTPPQPQ